MKIESGQVAVITGGASGIGFGVAQQLGARGVKLTIADVREDALLAAEQKLGDLGYEVLTSRTDVSDADSVKSLADDVMNTFGRVDLVFNNAGVVGPIAPMWEQRLEDWNWLINVKLMGVVNGIRSFAPILIARGSGHIVNTASAGGLIPLPGMTPYNATMHAVVGLTETLDYELKSVNTALGATVLCPGLVATPLFENTAALQKDSVADQSDAAVALAAEMSAGQSAGVVSPEQVAESALAAIENGRLHAMPGTAGSPAIRQRAESVIADFDLET